MSFTYSDIRPWMDVYTLDGHYLGMVLRIRAGKSIDEPDRVPPDARQYSTPNGEFLGPVPTQQYGNSGPIRQSPGQQYATDRLQVESIGDGSLFVGKYFGLSSRRTIPVSAIQTVSMERIVLRHRSDQLDQALVAQTD